MKDRWLHALVLGPVLAFFAPVFVFGRALYMRDTGIYFWPHKVLQGQWNPHEYGGFPLWVDPNFNTFHPLTWLLSWWRTPSGFALFVALHVVIAGYGAYGWARALGRPRLAARVTAFTFIAGGTFVSLVEGGQVIALAFAPWFGWAAARQRTGALAVVTALAIVSGTPEFVLVGVCVAALSARDYKTLLRGLPWGGALAAVQIMPLVRYLGESSRGGALPFDEVTKFSLHPLRLVDFVVPFFMGAPDAPGVPYWWSNDFPQPYILENYWGALVTALAVVALTTRFAKRHKWLVVAAGAAIVLALGAYTPLTSQLFQHVSLLRRFRYPEKLVALPAVIVPLLAGVGAHRLVAWARAARASHAAPRVAIVGFAGVLLVQPVANALASKRGELAQACIDATLTPSLRLELVVLLLAAVIAELARRRRISIPRAARLGMALVVFELASPAAHLDFTIPTEELTARSPLLDIITRDADLPLHEFRIDERHPELTVRDIDGVGAPTWLRPRREFWLRRVGLYGANPALDGVLLARGYSGMTPSRTKALYTGPNGSDSLNLLSVRYGITLSREPSKVYERVGFRWLGEAANGLVQLYKNEHAQPRVRVLDAAGKDIVNARGEITRYESDDVTLSVSTPVSGTVLLNDTWNEGWAVTVDDQPQASRLMLTALRGVDVGAGAHTIHWHFTTPGLRIGAAISLVALALLAVYGTMVWRRAAPSANSGK